MTPRILCLRALLGALVLLCAAPVARASHPLRTIGEDILRVQYPAHLPRPIVECGREPKVEHENGMRTECCNLLPYSQTQRWIIPVIRILALCDRKAQSVAKAAGEPIPAGVARFRLQVWQLHESPSPM
jgi:hypothetical protein